MKDLHKELIKILQSLPGIEPISNNLSDSFDRIKSNWGGNLILFYSHEKEPEGLFFLTRCLDARYWEYGNLWRIELKVGDTTLSNGDRPLIYTIFRPFIGPKGGVAEETEMGIDKEISSLIDNMHFHFNHNSFMSGFNMNRKKYDLKEWGREIKLSELGL